MTEPRQRQLHEHEFGEVYEKDPPQDRPTFVDLKDVRLNLSADLGIATLTVREVLELKSGSVIPLNKLAGETTDIYVNGIPLARAEVVVIADVLHVRVAEVLGVSPEEKDASYDE